MIESLTSPFLNNMAQADSQTDLPSPTHRDSAASAIFNLYGYSSRNSSHSQGTFGGFPPSHAGIENGHLRSHVYPEENGQDGLVEELRSPKVENFADQRRSLETAPLDSSRHLSDGALDQGPTDTVHALGPPISDTVSLNSRQPLESPEKYRTSSIHRPASITDQQGSTSSAPERSTRDRRRSSAVSVVLANNACTTISNLSGTEHVKDQVAVSPAQPASNRESPRDMNSQADPIARRRPGEEDDAYHVRSTCEYPCTCPIRRPLMCKSQ